jgi:ATP adenylyltransferase
MRISYIYQLLILMQLLGPPQPSPGAGRIPAVLRQSLVGKVLTRNVITAYDNDAYSLILGDDLQQLCRLRLDAFREQRGEDVSAHRSLHCTPISGSVKYKDHRHAQCYGAHEHQRALEVDHIIPKNQGGSDAISNLQALCFRCNAGKRDGCLPMQEGAPTPAVCRPATATGKRAVCSARWREAAGVLLENELALCIADAYPVSEGHSLVIPLRHGPTGWSCTSRSGTPWWSC